MSRYYDEEDVIAEYEKAIQKKDNEIERLNKEKESLQCDLDNANSKASIYAKRCLKAIKLIEDDYFEDGSGNNIDEVLEILKGEDNE